MCIYKSWQQLLQNINISLRVMKFANNEQPTGNDGVQHVTLFRFHLHSITMASQHSSQTFPKTI